MIVQFNEIGHPTKRLASRCALWERLVDGGLTGFRLARHEAWRRNDRNGDDAFPVARDMAQQARRRAQGPVSQIVEAQKTAVTPRGPSRLLCPDFRDLLESIWSINGSL